MNEYMDSRIYVLKCFLSRLCVGVYFKRKHLPSWMGKYWGKRRLWPWDPLMIDTSCLLRLLMVHNSLCIFPCKTWRSWATAMDCSLHEARSRFLNMRKKGSALLNSFSLARQQYHTMHRGSWATLRYPWNIPGAAVDVETVLVLPVYFMPNELNVEARSESISEVSEDSHCNHYCHISSFFFHTVHRFGFYGIPFPSKKSVDSGNSLTLSQNLLFNSE